MKFLHCYGQPQWHDSVAIVGNRAALEALSAQINKVLESKQPSPFSEDEYTVGDGEGFETTIILMKDGEEEQWFRPYTSEAAKDHRTHGLSPFMPPGLPGCDDPNKDA